MGTDEILKLDCSIKAMSRVIAYTVGGVLSVGVTVDVHRSLTF